MLYVYYISKLTFLHLWSNLELWKTASVFNYVCESMTGAL